MAASVNAKYEADSGDIHPIRLRPDTNLVAGVEPSGAITNNIRVKVSKGNREFGMRPRGVTISLAKGSGTDTYTVRQFIPVLTPAAFGVSPFVVGGTVTYQGGSWTVISLRAEDIN